MQFIPDIRSYSGEPIFGENRISITRVFGRRDEKYRYVVRLFSLECSVASGKEVSPYDILDFVVKNNPNSGYYLIRTIVAESIRLGQAQGREELQNQFKKLLDI